MPVWRMRRLPGAWGGRLAVFFVALLAHSTAHSQLMVMSADGETPQNQQNGFNVATDESLMNTFSDFERHVERKAWEKAFATLNEIPAEKRTGMLARKDGLVIPAQQRIWESISELPAEGRDAFRVFNDAKARQAWQPVASGTASLPEQISIAQKIHQEFFLTTVGDNAADLLGDAAFEQGDFEQADRYWRSILDKHPDSDLSEERLLFKRGLAQAQMGSASAAEGIRRSLVQRFSGSKMRVGNRTIEPAEYLREMIAAIKPPTGQLAARPVPYTLPDADATPVWRTQFQTPRLIQQFEQSARNNYYYRNGMETLVPASATDGERMYCNWFGICFAVDLKSGKLLWRTNKFSDLNNHIGNLPHSGCDLDGYWMAAGNGIVLSVTMPMDRLNYWQEPFRLICYEAATGKEKWKSQDNQTLNNTSFIGLPLIEAEQIFVLGHGRGEAKVSLHCLNMAGQSQWSVDLGNANKRQTPRGSETMPQPIMVRRGGTMYVATQDGALLAVDLDERKLKWMLTYNGPEVTQRGRVFYSGMTDDVTQLHTRTALLEYEGTLYIKEAGSRELVAIDPSGPSVLWKRPVERAAQLVAVDQDAIYTLDSELSSYDRKNKTLRWATRLPIASGGLSAIVGQDSVLVLTGRGLFQLDRKSGNVRKIFRGADLKSAGGQLQMIGDQLVALTTLSVTSYGDAAVRPAAAGQ